MTDTYRQCVLCKEVIGGQARMIGWLPEHLAIPGLTLGRDDADAGIFKSGWRVDMVCGSVPTIGLPDAQASENANPRFSWKN